MVGFPGETEGDFKMTLDLIKTIEFDSLFSFKYSDREGTLAEKMGPKISESEKSSRLKELQNLQKEITLRKNRYLEGKLVEVLVDGQGKRKDQIAGRIPQNKIVNFASNIRMIGRLVNVKIKRGLLNSLRGEIPENTS
jgi:tRNA-2-methylthio-N6-dimethylallyladenosine synthase